MDKKYTVYTHIVPKEISDYSYDKYYVGITNRPVVKRWKNGKGYIDQRLFYRAIEKYGWKNIQHKIIAEGLTKEEACAMEIELISKYKSNQEEYGYNVTTGGESHFHFNHSTETREKISKSLIGNQRAKGKNLGNQHAKGNHLSQETRNKMSENRKGNSNNGVSIIKCVETGIIKRAREWTLAGYANAYNVANGKAKTCKGYHFIRLEV